MKLYYAPGACSLAPHIVMRDLGLPVDLLKVDLVKHTLSDGSDYRRVNPKGYVPMLELDDGARLTAYQERVAARPAVQAALAAEGLTR